MCYPDDKFNFRLKQVAVNTLTAAQFMASLGLPQLEKLSFSNNKLDFCLAVTNYQAAQPPWIVG
jgi:hypothetical protein